MRTRPVFCLAVAFIPILSASAPAQGDARPVIEKAIKALGGEEVLTYRAAVHARVKVSYIGLPGGGALPDLGITGEIWTQKGSMRTDLVVVLPGQKMTMTRAVHNGQGWQQDNGAPRDMTAEEKAEWERSEYVDRVLGLVPLLKEKGLTVEALGKKKVDGAELVGVKVSSAGKPDVTIYFDPETGYPKRYEYRARMAALAKEVTTATAFDDFRAADPAATEERALKEAKVATDAAGLLKFLRGQVRSDADRDKVKGLVKDLGDDSFEVRENAQQELTRLGAVALPELRQAVKSADAEIATRARRCLDSIVKVSGPDGLLWSALRLVAARKPAGAAEVLLALAPGLPDEADARELRNALAAVALRDGKPDPAVQKALEDKDPARRAAAAAALGQDGGAFDKQPGRRVFPTGLKRPMKTTYYQDGEKQMVLEVTEAEYFNRFEDKLFAKPK
jgi:hypothetical protein